MIEMVKRTEGLLRGEGVYMYTLHRRYIRNDCLCGGGGGRT